MDALLGFDKKLTTITGQRIPVSHHQSTFSRFSKVFPGHGLPVFQRDPEASGTSLKHVLGRGALVVNFDIVFPEYLNTEDKELLENVLDIEVRRVVCGGVACTCAGAGLGSVCQARLSADALCGTRLGFNSVWSKYGGCCSENGHRVGHRATVLPLQVHPHHIHRRRGVLFTVLVR